MSISPTHRVVTGYSLRVLYDDDDSTPVATWKAVFSRILNAWLSCLCGYPECMVMNNALCLFSVAVLGVLGGFIRLQCAEVAV
jgi:hypothetical protein